MFYKLILTALALEVGAFSASAQYGRYEAQDRSGYSSNRQGYHVQFRQPYWREHQFRTWEEAADFSETQRRLGWEVQMFPSGRGRHVVRYRLTDWGGSRMFDNLSEARDWAAHLEDRGYEPRIVEYP